MSLLNGQYAVLNIQYHGEIGLELVRCEVDGMEVWSISTFDNGHLSDKYMYTALHQL